MIPEDPSARLTRMTNRNFYLQSFIAVVSAVYSSIMVYAAISQISGEVEWWMVLQPQLALPLLFYRNNQTSGWIMVSLSRRFPVIVGLLLPILTMGIANILTLQRDAIFPVSTRILLAIFASAPIFAYGVFLLGRAGRKS